MFNADFYPTPAHIIEMMCNRLTLEGSTILEPSAGKGDIIDALILQGAEVLACEKNEDLAEIVKSKCRFLKSDFLTVTSDEISHINGVIMNPPFSRGAEHILHAFNIAPPGCKIIALCNLSNIENTYTQQRQELATIINTYGNYEDIGKAFTTAERQTEVDIAFIVIDKPAEDYKTEFGGFFMEEDEQIGGEYGILKHDFIREIVQRYTGAVQIFDEQLNAAVKMNEICKFYNSSIAMHVSADNKPIKRNEFKKDLQKSAWMYIFKELNMNKYATRGLREDINKFVEQQQQIPFTMKNIYKMLEIIVGTHSQRMDKALLEVFDAVTMHHSENRYNVPGWKTNSHYLIGEIFILPGVVDSDKWSWNASRVSLSSYRNSELISDLQKALCYLTATKYDDCTTLSDFTRNIHMEYGKWYSWGFFEIKGYKKGTMHFKFNSQDLWGKFNQEVARIKGYPLFEAKTQTEYQKRNTGRSAQKTTAPASKIFSTAD